jgi:hypothetical protein
MLYAPLTSPMRANAHKQKNIKPEDDCY